MDDVKLQYLAFLHPVNIGSNHKDFAPNQVDGTQNHFHDNWLPLPVSFIFRE